MMKSGVASLAPKHKPEECVLCLEPTAPLSEEHIFPDAAGGRISFPILCSQCNSDMGRHVDAPFLKQKNVEIARSAHRAAGKTGKVPQPFSDAYVIESSNGQLKFKLDTDYVPRIVPSAPALSVTKNGEIRLEASFDAADRAEIPKVIRKSLSRFFQSEEGRGLEWTLEQQESAIQRSIAGAEKISPVPEKVRLQMKGGWTIDINALFAEQVKVIYEIACLEFGPAFVRGAEGARIREFLRAKCSGIASDEGWLEASKSLGMAPFVNQQISEFVDQITAGQRCSVHIALVTPAGIVCSLLGVGITFPTEKVEYDFAIEDARAYVSYIDGSFGCILPFHKLPELADIRERTRSGG